jgi:PAS domain S-box-containing protein
MPALKANFLDKVLGRVSRLDKEGLQTVVERLAQERTFLETLFNTIEDGILVVDAEGRVIYLNQAATRLLGVRAESAEGQSVHRLLPELDWAELASSSRAAGSWVVRHEFEVTYPRPRFLRLYAASLDGGAAGAKGVALILHDATEARQQTFAAIESERIHALTLLAASVAHEIGNPLNALHIHLQLMDRQLQKLRLSETSASARPPRRRAPRAAAETSAAEAIARLDQYLGVAKGEIARLDYIVTQFLQAIRPGTPQMRQASLNDVVRDVLNLLGPEIANRGLIVRERLARDLPPCSFDPAQMKQVLVNLIKNALQAMTTGGVLTLETGAGAEGVWFSVSDTGAGIPRNQLNRIFEPFYTTKQKGSGLGLMIVQRILRDHQGRIELESQEGQGTAFRCWLPLQSRGPRLLEGPNHD